METNRADRELGESQQGVFKRRLDKLMNGDTDWLCRQIKLTQGLTRV